MRDEKEQQFNSPSRGRIAFSEVIYSLVDYMEEYPQKKYHLIIGTDSRANGHNSASHKIDLVTAIVIHRLGKGGRYFWRRETKENVHTLRQKIYEETNSSLATAQQLLNTLNKYLISARRPGRASLEAGGNPIPKPPKYELEIHVDIGQEGPTREMIKEIVGMVQGYGFNAKTKPEAYAASKVADKHT